MGKDDKNSCWELIPAIVLLLSRKSPDTIPYIPTILNMVYMVDYTSHTDKTVQYMGLALIRIDKTKEPFWDACHTTTQICNSELGNFNFPKWYIIML